ncbi:hypothetical protein O9992_23610 [Vibrio lentus]|nr:hypothetical protein [Vibrio lentus]
MEMNPLYIMVKRLTLPQAKLSSVRILQRRTYRNAWAASSADVENAIESAKRGFAVWSAMTAVERSRN